MQRRSPCSLTVRDFDMSQMPPHRRPRSDRRTLILVLGILSLVLCQLIGPFVWMMGNDDLRKIRAGRLDPAAEPMTKAGMIFGIIATVLLVVGLLLFLLPGGDVFAA